jgi:hypothetical protein
VAVRGGLEDWTAAGHVGVVGAALQLRSPGDRVDARVSIDAWRGASAFTMTAAGLTVRSSTDRSGRVYVGRIGAGATSRTTPADAWFGGDTGTARATLLRAHPVIDDGELRTGRIGRRIAYGSGEAQYWWPARLAGIGAALFVDAARVGAGLNSGLRADVDVGAGARLALPGMSGTFRADVARGLRDGAATFSFVYEP